MSNFSESVVEDAALGWLEALGYQVLHGPDIAVGELAAERSNSNYCDVGLDQHLCETVQPLVHGDLWFESPEKFVGMGR
ncbi:MAG: hypothetical protein P0120_02790 [Nitrospira sp.]|nr:hypothetical protein [Nitrospira sp.]